jgi:short-subunit dehydrogenase
LRAEPASVLVTGATGGIGGALALEYAQAGRTLVLHGRDEAKLAAIAAECRARGAVVRTFEADLLDLPGYLARLEAAVRDLPIDLAIVNAGVSATRKREGEDWNETSRLLDVNVRATMATVAALVPAMRARGAGQVALVSSLAAYFGLPLTPAYCASKAAIKAYGEAMRGWLGPQGVAVNVVMPGFVESAMSRGFPGSKPFMLSAPEAARVIRQGLVRDRARIAFPQPLALGTWLLAAMPAAWSGAIVRRLRY